MNLIHTLLSFVLALGILIFVHELGHYLVARWCGVKVLRFSVGFGKALVMRRVGRDGTEWVIAAFPLGGYVKMLDEREGEVARGDLPRAFNRQSVQKRFAIVAAGPLANFLLAILLYWGLYIHGVPGMKPVLGPVPEASAAAAAGFREGDTISRVGDTAVATWSDARWVLLKHAVGRSAVEIEVQDETGRRLSRRLELSGLGSGELDGDFIRELGLTVFQPLVRPVIGKVMGGSAAERAGLQPGDEILALDGNPVGRWEELVRAVREAPGRTLEVELRRGGKDMALEVTPDASGAPGKAVGRIGVGPEVDPAHLERLMVQVRYGPVQALGRALDKTWETSVFSLQVMWKMITGEVSWKNVSGPITIADYAGQSAQMGWIYYVVFLASISISLGVLNLLPIPLLDGGHLMYYMVELARGSPLSEKAMEIGQQVGIALLFTLMAFAIYNDINRLLSG
ncbi:MAG TPA: RIP metalloprotease RseP [Burkholderiales bacterium]|nr:RIP metalloprotease RseP [Burkholderiales bacterium]